jgi:AhpD family alkylhydroperoxidase
MAVKMYNGDGDKKAQAIQADLKKAFGFLPEVFQAMGRNGDFLDALLKLDAAAGKGLDPKTKELICVAVSAVNGCGYCLDAHRALGLKAGLTEEEITAALEVAATMSAFNKFNAALGMNHDIKA